MGRKAAGGGEDVTPELQRALERYGQGSEVKGKDKTLVPEWDGPHNDVCQMCSKGGNVLLCDYCNLCYHTHCLRPPLKEIPEVRPCPYFHVCAVDGISDLVFRRCCPRRIAESNHE